MRKIIIVILLFLMVGCSSKSNYTSVALKISEGQKPFNFSQKFCFENQLDSILIDNIASPKSNIQLSLRIFHTQPNFYYHFLLSEGIIDSQKFNGLMARYNYSFKDFVPKFVDEGILVGIGKQDDSTIVCFVDKNNNNNLSDDLPIYYKIYDNFEDENIAMDNLQIINVMCENYDGKEIKSINIPIFLNPYKGRLQLDGSWAEQDYLAIGINQHRSGFFRIKDRRYNFQLTNRNTSTIYTNNNVKIIYSNKPDSIILKMTDDDITCNIGDIINIDDFDIRIDSIDFFGTNLFVSELGENKKHVGIRIGNKAPTIDGQGLDGFYYNSTDFNGKYILLDFWGTWCGPCIKEIPYLKKIYNDISSDKLQIISIAVDEKSENVLNFIKENEMNWIHYFQSFDDNSPNSLTNRYKVKKFPSTFLLDKDGRIIDKNLRGEELLNKLNKLIGI